MDLYQAIKNRRTQYEITDTSTISNERIEEIVKECVTFVPSAFNSQSSRVVLLFGERHKKLWSIVKESLRAIVPNEKFEPTEKKIDAFAAGHGSILYFEDMDTIEQMQKSFPSYANNFPIWSNQSAGMLQFAIWTALSSEGLGASLQHYNPIIDAKVAHEFSVPRNWKLLAQMPFGTIVNQAAPIEHKAIAERFILQGK